MTDPLSAVGSVIAILQLSSTVLKYLRSVVGASEDIERTRQELITFRGLLYQLKELADADEEDDSGSAILTTLNASEGPFQKCKAALELIESKLYPAAGSSKLSKVLAWPFQKKEIREILNVIEGQKILFLLALQRDHVALSRQIRSGILPLARSIQQVSQEIAQVQRDQKAFLDDRESRDILAWLSPLNFRSTQSDIHQRCQQGTGQWFLNSSQFRDWLLGSGRTIWCPGIPGAGKTFLASIVVHHLEQQFAGQTDVGIACIFCDYRESDLQTPVNLLASVCAQLINSRAGLPEFAKTLYRQNAANKTRPSLEETSILLRTEIERYNKIFVVVDALDECPHASVRGTLSQLQVLPITVNLMITSRPHIKMVGAFEGYESLEIRAQEEDVRAYLEGQISTLSDCVGRNAKLQEMVINAVLKAVDGMFLLARLHIDSLRDKVTVKDVKKAIEILPKGQDALHSAYREALKRIDSQMRGHRELANRVLSWIIHAYRPLRVAELRHALAVSPGDSSLDHDAVPEEEALTSYCAGLVIIDQKSQIVRLVHYTAQEYVNSVRELRYPDAHTLIAEACLTYVLFDISANIPRLTEDGMDAFRIEFPGKTMESWLHEQCVFFPYAAKKWGRHAHEGSEEVVEDLIFKLFEQKALFSRCVNELLGLLRWRRNITPLMVSAFLGLEKTCQTLLEKGAGVNTKSSTNLTALHFAVRERHRYIVQLLLENGADVEAATHTKYRPLHIATRNGDLEMVKLLLKCDADITPMSGISNPLTMLDHAVAAGSEEIVELLLLQGAKAASHVAPCLSIQDWLADKVNRQVVYDCEDDIVDTWTRFPGGRTALQVAAEEGREDIVRQLLQDGADIQSVAFQGDMSALELAVSKGHLAVVTELVHAGAKIKHWKYDWFAVRCAMETCSLGILTELVENGALEDFTGGLLHLAAMFSRPDLIGKLVSDGAYAESADLHGRRPMHYAARIGHAFGIQSLICVGADIDSQDCRGLTPLHHAARNGNLSATIGLLDAGAAIEIRDMDGRLPLHHAALSGDASVVSELLAAGADVNNPCMCNMYPGHGATALHLAALYGCLGVVEVLLDSGASPFIEDSEGDNPLTYAKIGMKGCSKRIGGRHGWKGDHDVIIDKLDDTRILGENRAEHVLDIYV